MQACLRTLYTVLFFIVLLPLANAQPNSFFCIGITDVVNDANQQFVQQTGRDRIYLLNTANEDRYDATFGLAFFEYEKIISRGIEGLYYECMIPNIPDSASVHIALMEMDYNLVGCLSGLKRNPRGDSLIYTYHYEDGDTVEEIFIRMWGTYPTIDADSFRSAGQLNMEIYGDVRRRFVPYKVDAKKADPVLKNEFQQIEKGLLDDIKPIRGKATKDLYNQTIYKTNVMIPGAGNAYIKAIPENLAMPFGYFAEFYVGPSLAEAKKIFKTWDGKVKNNAFADKRFSQKNRQRLQWKFLPYNEFFDPNDYANIVEQSGYSCPIYSEEPLNRTPLFTYHLFIIKYLDSYIVGLNIANRY